MDFRDDWCVGKLIGDTDQPDVREGRWTPRQHTMSAVNMAEDVNPRFDPHNCIKQLTAPGVRFTGRMIKHAVWRTMGNEHLDSNRNVRIAPLPVGGGAKPECTAV